MDLYRLIKVYITPLVKKTVRTVGIDAGRQQRKRCQSAGVERYTYRHTHALLLALLGLCVCVCVCVCVSVCVCVCISTSSWANTLHTHTNVPWSLKATGHCLSYKAIHELHFVLSRVCKVLLWFSWSHVTKMSSLFVYHHHILVVCMKCYGRESLYNEHRTVAFNVCYYS